MFHFQKQGGELRPFHFATNRYPTEKPRQSRGNFSFVFSL
jgi:hypothetical protein